MNFRETKIAKIRQYFIKIVDSYLEHFVNSCIIVRHFINTFYLRTFIRLIEYLFCFAKCLFFFNSGRNVFDKRTKFKFSNLTRKFPFC
jgi:hypothetical protein